MADPLIEEMERQAREAAEREKAERDKRPIDVTEKTIPPLKYNPRITSKPGEGLEFMVDLPDNHTTGQMIEAIEEAAKMLGLDV